MPTSTFLLPLSLVIAHASSPYKASMKGKAVEEEEEDYDNSKVRRKFNPAAIIMTSSIKAWAAQDKNGLKDFIIAQLKVAAILAVAYIGNKFEPAYPRNDNHDPTVFWIVNAFLAVGSLFTWKWEASKTGRSGGNPRIICLGREQTEEWKGWMQWGFIFYHYYRVYYVYNEIRVFVSAYVWMVSFHCALCIVDRRGAVTYHMYMLILYSPNCCVLYRLALETFYTLIRRGTFPLNDSFP